MKQLVKSYLVLTYSNLYLAIILVCRNQSRKSLFFKDLRIQVQIRSLIVTIYIAHKRP